MSRAEDLFKKLVTEGEKAIDELIINKQAEELFLDFKRSSDQGKDIRLHQNDRNNLAKAITGFGNSEGGIIVWGIECSNNERYEDLPNTKYPIFNPSRFVAWIEAAISGLTLPAHNLVQNHKIITDKKNDNGFVITLIPKYSSAPLQTIYNSTFYIRAGSNFLPAPYQVLAAMFGKKPQPFIFSKLVVGPPKVDDDVIVLQVGVLIRNQGPGIAYDTYLNAWIQDFGGDSTQVGMQQSESTKWSGSWSFGRMMSLICPKDERLAPGSHIQPLIVQINLKPPFTKGALITFDCGCEGSAAYHSEIKSTKEDIQKAYDDFMTKYQRNEVDKKMEHDFTSKVLGMEMLN